MALRPAIFGRRHGVWARGGRVLRTEAGPGLGSGLESGLGEMLWR
jgi:hypothetical protein